MITPHPLHPPLAGGRQRSQLLFRALRQCAHVDLFVVADIDAISDADKEILKSEFNLVGSMPAKRRGEHGVWRILRPLAPNLVDRLAHNLGRRSIDYRPDGRVAHELRRLNEIRKYDLIVGRYLLPTVKTGAFEFGSPVIVDVDDLESQIYKDRIAAPTTTYWERTILASHLRRIEGVSKSRLAQGAHLWFSCDADVSQFRMKASVLPNIPFFASDSTHTAATPAVQQDTESEGRVLVVGSFNHSPNVRGVEWFLHNVWPAILEARAHTELHIVGSGLNTETENRWRSLKKVQVVGYVDDISEQYRQASVVVAPVFEGGGTKIKVIESLHYRRATVVTPHALRGYSHLLKDEHSVLVAGSSKDFAAAVVRLLGDKALRVRLGRTGGQIVETQLSWERFVEIVRETLQKVQPACGQDVGDPRPRTALSAAVLD